MRALIVTLMIVLLPLRAWLGDAMAVQMLAEYPDATQSIAASAYETRPASTFSVNSETLQLPCHEVGPAIQHGPNTLVSTGADDHSDCDYQCSACQVCHGAALFVATDPLALLAQPTVLVHGTQDLFTSVPRAPHLKPPIS